MHPDLFPYQRDGAEWLADHWSPNLLLGDQMGVGKSAQAIAGADLVNARNILVICPGIARENWMREVLRWQTKKRSVGVVWSSKQVPPSDVVIASYSGLPSRRTLERLMYRSWDLIVADELHMIKAPDARRTRCVYGTKCDGQKGLKSRTKRFWGLSGTPIPNNLSEMWTHANALWPSAVEGGLHTYRRWRDHFCVELETDYGTRIIGTRNREDFIRRVKPFVLRRNLMDIHKDMPPLRIAQVVVQPDHLPPRTDEINEVEMIVRAALAKAAGGKTDQAKIAMAAAKDFHIASLRKWTGIAKAPSVVAQLRDDFASGMDKVVVFAFHTEVIDILAKGLPNSAVIDGRTPMKTRDQIIDAFQGRITGLNVTSLITHIDIASTALTLTASCNVAFAETTWVPKDLQQPIARCHRLGQKRPVLARVFSLNGSVDEQIGATLTRKAREISHFDAALAA